MSAPQRRHRAGPCEEDRRVELLGELGLAIVALALCRRAVDDSDRTLEPGPDEGASKLWIAAHQQREGGKPGLVEQRRPAFAERRSHRIDPAPLVPSGRGVHLPFIAEEADREGIFAV